MKHIFKDTYATSCLQSLAISVDEINSGQDLKDWTLAKKINLKTALRKDSLFMKHLRLNARQYNYTTESFINFYVVSICRKITPHEFENPSLEVQEKLHDILEFCDRKFLYESMMEGR